jgi:hypothetical protein
MVSYVAENGQPRSQLTRLSDGLTYGLLRTSWPYGYWWTDGIGYGIDYPEHRRSTGGPPPSIVTARIEPSGKLVEGRFAPWQVGMFHPLPSSPNGEYAALARSVRISNVDRKYEFRFVDIPREQTLSTIIRGVKGYWWQDDNTFGWIDTQGNRHLTKVGR